MVKEKRKPALRIEEIRKKRDWSMEDLAKAVNTTSGQINKLEKGQRKLSLDWMIRLSKALDCHPADLIEWDTPPKIGGEQANTDPDLLSIIETFVDTFIAGQDMAARRDELVDIAYQVARRHLKGGISPFNKDFMAELQREIDHALLRD